jgi:hypothetical protein
LAVEQVGNRSVKVGLFDSGLAPGASDRPEVVVEQSDIAVDTGDMGVTTGIG